ncbi:TetR family transcriptional regulator [Brevibacterium sediminis]|uniref:Transcriptional regulator n=1 Tax=Brevibacterium sediminis TaxID=1857024 RepID=A0ABQ1MVR1_9MICO|nr:TetR/AcrR family transcriptional regulator [Brevibacterium sediminis]MCS4593770.1 TetR family transcriptional regulator [Brevibacterium sediminis]GGC45255.1 transcriptional regulator [Brevibacterium sediminis]
MARKSAAVRREEILAATVEEIEATGLRALRVSDVAARLGLSASLVIYHFETKEALVAEAFDFAGRQDIDRARELAAGQVSALQRLRDVVGWYLPSGSSRSWKIWIDAWSAGLFDAGLRATFAALDREWKSILVHLMDEAIAAGECTAPEGGTASGATRVLAFLDGLAIQVMVNSETVDTEALSTWVDDFLTRELG